MTNIMIGADGSAWVEVLTGEVAARYYPDPTCQQCQGTGWLEDGLGYRGCCPCLADQVREPQRPKGANRG